MIKEVKMYTVICDSCGKDAGSEGDYSCWNDAGYSRDEAVNSFDWHEEGNKHYCPDCYEFDDDDNLILK